MPKKAKNSSAFPPSDKTSLESTNEEATEHENPARRGPLWVLKVQFYFKEIPDGEYVGGKLVCNHRNRVAIANIPIPITDYPDFVRDLLKLETLDDVQVEELLGFFTGLNKNRSLE